MRAGFYQKLAVDGIRKNKRMYLPYILTCVCMVMMEYIILSMSYSETIHSMRGGGQTMYILGLGGWVIAVFSCLFLFYTNSFLIKGRKKEFGLYNILGMEKRHIGFILFWESAIIGAGSILAGMLAGILFSKLAELGLCNVMQEEISYHLSISLKAIGRTAAIFAVIFLLLLLNSLRQVRFSSVVSLLKSENVGEKPPKANWFLGVLGVVILGGAYYLAVSAENPITAIFLFFIAVIMVVAATYMIMISGSVVFCRLLQKNKSYYYQPNHFVSVSSMAYRMKRNGAGLASICILATMVLVMISSTASLYFGNEDALRSNFPRGVNVGAYFASLDTMSAELTDSMRTAIDESAERNGMQIQNAYEYKQASLAAALQGDKLEADKNKLESSFAEGLSNLAEISIIGVEEYNAITGKSETLGEGEAFVYCDAFVYSYDTISFNRAESFKVVKALDRKELEDCISSSVTGLNMILVVNDLNTAIPLLGQMTYSYNTNTSHVLNLAWEYHFDTGLPAEEQLEAFDRVKDDFKETNYGYTRCLFESREANRADFFASFGGLFYLGIILSIVFIIAAVLIIYYKQVSEGYEDQSRFDIMKKLGMTGREIRKSINSQLLTVFYMPLILAGMHICFAFPMIRKLLRLFGLTNVWIFAAVSLICFAAFALLYAVIYRITSNAYFNIVNTKK